jgi:hypothetical protein
MEALTERPRPLRVDQAPAVLKYPTSLDGGEIFG